MGVVSFSREIDKSGILVRKYCPELAGFPEGESVFPEPEILSIEFCFAARVESSTTPYLAPRRVQQNAGCIIGRDYPLSMLGEKVEKERCIQRMKAAYALGLYGNHPSVLNGSADAMFHPVPTSDDRISCGKKKLGSRRRDEEWGDYPRKGLETANSKGGTQCQHGPLHINDGAREDSGTYRGESTVLYSRFVSNGGCLCF
ncbi:hypothetical protein JVT61DRAFT_10259 [Boletus reticuloceps]|uniref:Cryptochrome/DNA photolyase FAD-binding domain-containing protein n=1 Tax=Boletus reticuloceps TaxID=495285 RepID=A0A8I2YWX1_9AGAM|nr:hypothetical protein JVT61DRAFT_10259 [Boletus reticuloceps]